MTRVSLLVVGVVGLLASLQAPAGAVPVLSENFQGVTGATNDVPALISSHLAQLSTGAAGTQVRETLTSNPATTFSTAPNANVRLSTDLSNTSNVTSGWFSNKFTSKFMVLGDAAQELNDVTKNHTEYVRFKLASMPSFSHLVVKFDWGFAGVDTSTSETDVFSVNVVTSTGSVLASVFTKQSPTDYGTGTFTSSTINAPGGGWGSDVWLEFKVTESGLTENSTNSAAGVDNISVTATTPEPGSLALIGAGLLALGLVVCRRRTPSQTSSR